MASGEAAYQGFEMLFHGEEEGYLTCVKGHVSGWEVMRMGKKVKASNEWKKVEDGVMREIVRSKWEQSERVRQAIGESGERRIVEDTPHVKWGRGTDGNGENKLGKL